MQTRDQATDRRGLPLAPGLSVRWLDGAGQPEARIVRVVGDYDLVTVVMDDGAGRAERMVPCAEIELLVPARVTVQTRRNVA